ncbi:hypothetical protein SKAU_G00264270 [Synaphobranchus kaupii]|uniref:Uncharacterized protein n=1 Tax=Synaphobranchus kaupii TaxID=118154 RepID=A0A9Q1EZ27_SYNKA|nr:hypothetical protein SKAU_G00264270 [Synaphobranchus kaupii]
MLKMVRPYSGSLRQKHRPFSQSYVSHEPHGRMQRLDHYGSHSRVQREFHEVKAPQWREPRGGGPLRGRPPHFTKGPRLMEWRDSAQHFHRPAGVLTGVQDPQERTGAGIVLLAGDRSPGDRLFDRLPRGERWNGTRGFLRPRSWECRFSNSPQRKSQEFHRRGSYPERYRSEAAVQAGLSTEREARRNSESEREMEENRRSMEWGERNSPHHSYRTPKWKAGSAPSSPRFHQHQHIQERPTGRPMKRKHPEGGPLPAGPGFEHCPKRARRETPQRFHGAKGFGGRGLSLKDKSRLLKGRKLRAVPETGDKHKPSALTLKPKHPKTQPPKDEKQEEEEEEEEEEEKPKPCPSVRKARSTITLQNEQPEASKDEALKKRNLKRAPHKMSCPPDATANSPRETETLTIKVDTRHTLNTHSSSPSDRQLSRDLVTVSRRGLGSRPEEKNTAPWRDRAQKTQTTESCFSFHGNLTLNERFSKLQNSTSSPREQSGRYSGLKRQVDMPLLNQKTAKPIKIMGPPQRPSFRPSSPEATDGQPGGAPSLPAEASVQEEPEHYVQVPQPAGAALPGTCVPPLIVGTGEECQAWSTLACLVL